MEKYKRSTSNCALVHVSFVLDASNRLARYARERVIPWRAGESNYQRGTALFDDPSSSTQLSKRFSLRRDVAARPSPRSLSLRCQCISGAWHLHGVDASAKQAKSAMLLIPRLR